MKTLLLAFLIASGPAFAGAECYQLENDPSWTVLYDPRPADAEKPVLVWNRDGKTLDLGTYGAGTNTGTIFAAPLADDDGPEAYSFDVREGAIILDHGVYRLGCK